MARVWFLWFLLAFALSGIQRTDAAEGGFKGLSFSTPFPTQTVKVGEPVTLTLNVKNFGLPPQVVSLRVSSAPRGWRATFLGAGRVVEALYVAPDQESSVSVRLQPPTDVKPATYSFRLLAQGQDARAELPITLTLGHVLPRRLKLEAELPVLRGSPTSSFRYRLMLQNESDQDLLVNLEAQTPRGFQISFTLLGGQQVTSIPVKAGESRDVDAEVSLAPRVPAGSYPIVVRAIGGEARVDVKLSLEVTGRPELSVTGEQDRLSGRAYAGRETPLKLVVKNQGSAAAQNVSLSASEPSGWEVKFNPERVDEIAANSEAQVTASVKPSPKALTGDYMVNIRANAGDVSTSADFRITVLTSTLWGLVGVVLIAVALGVVTLAVNRFGRR